MSRKPYAKPMLFKLSLCQPCAAALRAVLHTQGEEALGTSLASILCEPCKSRMPGYEPGRRMTSVLKRVREGDGEGEA